MSLVTPLASVLVGSKHCIIMTEQDWVFSSLLPWWFCVWVSDNDDSLLWHNHHPRTSSSLTCKNLIWSQQPQSSGSSGLQSWFQSDMEAEMEMTSGWVTWLAGSDDMSHCPTLLSMVPFPLSKSLRCVLKPSQEASLSSSRLMFSGSPLSIREIFDCECLLSILRAW